MNRNRIKAVKNISISDAKNGHIIFQRVYSWKPTSAFPNLGLLIQCFYQFARTFDEGVITGIDFESPSKDQFRRKREDILRDQRGDTMHMLTAKTKNIIVSIFYDMHGAIKPSLQDKWAYQLLLHSVKIAFEVKYVQVFQFLSDEGTKTSVSGSSHFDDFTDIADYLCEAIFSPSSSVSLPQELLGATPSPPTTAEPSENACDATEAFVSEHVKSLLSAINIDVSEIGKLDFDYQHFLHPSTTVSESNTQAEDISQQQEEAEGLNLKVDYVENSL